jgi:hypothetical protein
MSNWNILVLDRSASMLSQKQRLIEGYNNLVNEQKEQGSTDKFTVIGFNTGVKTIKDEYFPNVSIMNDEDFITQGCTALLDAIGTVYNIILDNSEYDNVTITVITDGMENSSKIFTFDTLNDKRKEIDKHYNINFLFIGADISCLENNVMLSHVSQSVNYDGNIVQAMKTASRSMSSQRDGIEYIPDGVVNISPKESSTSQPSNVPMLNKRQHSSVDPPYVSRCEKLCRLG